MNCQTYPHLFPACLFGGQITAANDLAHRWHSGEARCTAVHPHPKSSQIKPFSITGKNASKLFRSPVFSDKLNQPTDSATGLIFLWDLLPPRGLAVNFKSQNRKSSELALDCRGKAQLFNWHKTSLKYQHHFCLSVKRFLCNRVTVVTFHFLEFTIIAIKYFKLNYNKMYWVFLWLWLTKK